MVSSTWISSNMGRRNHYKANGHDFIGEPPFAIVYLASKRHAPRVRIARKARDVTSRNKLFMTRSVGSIKRHVRAPNICLSFHAREARLVSSNYKIVTPDYSRISAAVDGLMAAGIKALKWRMSEIWVENSRGFDRIEQTNCHQ